MKKATEGRWRLKKEWYHIGVFFFLPQQTITSVKVSRPTRICPIQNAIPAARVGWHYSENSQWHHEAGIAKLTRCRRISLATSTRDYNQGCHVSTADSASEATGLRVDEEAAWTRKAGCASQTLDNATMLSSLSPLLFCSFTFRTLEVVLTLKAAPVHST